MLFVATIAFRVINPISPVGVAETFGASNIKSVWLPLQKISPDLPLAVIASEDGRFCNHWGVDWPAVGKPSTKVEGLEPDCAARVQSRCNWLRTYTFGPSEVICARLLRCHLPF